MLSRYEANTISPAWPSLIEGAIRIDHPMNTPETAEDEYVYWAN